jgi:hypothetical protein
MNRRVQQTSRAQRRRQDSVCKIGHWYGHSGTDTRIFLLEGEGDELISTLVVIWQF